jgi:hypothetical protein
MFHVTQIYTDYDSTILYFLQCIYILLLICKLPRF